MRQHGPILVLNLDKDFRFITGTEGLYNAEGPAGKTTAGE